MEITNELKLPEPLYEALCNDEYVKGDCDASMTELILPPRIRQLRERYGDQVKVDASDNIWSMVGRIGHGFIERYPGKATLAEERLYMTCNGWKISGTPDLLIKDALYDFKFTSVWAGQKVKWEYEQQVNGYCALIKSSKGIDVKKACLVCIFRDWSKKQALRHDYPSRQVKVLEVNLWSMEKVAAWMCQRVGVHKAAEELPDDLLPECSPAERWEKPAVFAVMKPKQKRAVKLCSSLNEAQAFVASKPDMKLAIQHRPGESPRCQDYCEVAPFCNQWKEIQKQMKEAM